MKPNLVTDDFFIVKYSLTYLNVLYLGIRRVWREHHGSAHESLLPLGSTTYEQIRNTLTSRLLAGGELRVRSHVSLNS